MRRRLRIIGGMGLLCGIFFGIQAAATTITLNASYSADHWGYFRLPADIWPWPAQRGDWVQFTPPVEARWPYVKQIHGLPGDMVHVRDDRMVLVNGKSVGVAKTHDLTGRPVEAIAPGAVPADHLFVTAPHRDSHDSRYAEIGFIPFEAVMARVWPLPDIPALGLDGPLLFPDPANENTKKGDTP